MATRVPATTGVEHVLAAAVRLLARRGLAAVDEVLELTRDALGAGAAITLRATHSGGLFAPALVARQAPARPVALAPVGLAAVPEQPSGRTWTLDAPVRAAPGVRGVLTASLPQSFGPVEAALLTGIADALALALASTSPTPGVLPLLPQLSPAADRFAGTADRLDGTAERLDPAAAPDGEGAQAVLDAEADRAQTAADLHAGVGQALVAIRYTAHRVTTGRLGPDALDEPLRAALAAFRQAHRDLRAYALERGLRGALHELASRSRGDQPDDGRPTLALEVAATDPGLDSLPPAIAVTVQRVAEAALRGATGEARLSASYDGFGVKLSVRSADIAYDASELDRWARRASAVGGALRLRPDGVELQLPAPSPRRKP